MPPTAPARVGMTQLLTGIMNENANTKLGRAGRKGQNAGKRLQGQPKRLTFREGRLRLPTGTTRVESQVFRLLCGGPMVLALILWSFPIKRKGQENRSPGCPLPRLPTQA